VLPDREIPGSPADWLARARGDLALARVPLPEGALYEDLCYHAQQAAEKAIKAVYRASNLAFRYTHDLAQLLGGLMSYGVAVPLEIRQAADLTVFAWQARYPGSGEPVAEPEYRQAVALAEQVVRWAESLVTRRTI
jgi:HEPN domain-containing protein